MKENHRRTRRFDASLDRRTLLSTVSGVALGTTLPTTAGATRPTEEHEEVASNVALTPRPDRTGVGGTRSLNGTWEFTLARSETPPTGSAPRTTTPGYSPAGNDGTLRDDPRVVTDPSERAVDLSGDSYVSVGDGSGLDFTAPGFTVQLTFKYAEDSILFSKGGRQYAAGVYGGELSFWTEGEGAWPTATGGDLRVGRWYTATFVVDEDAMRVFVDGTEVGSTTHGFSSIPSTDSPLQVGYDSANGTHGTPVVDSFRAFGTALTAAELEEGFDAVPDGAVAWLPFDSASDGVAPDESSAGNDGTLVNEPAFVSGRDGQGVDLSGQGYVSAGPDDSLNFTSPGFTVRATVKYDGGSGLLVDKGSSSVSSGAEQFGLGIYDGVVSFWAQADDGTWPTVDGGDLSVGEWHTVTAVVDGSELRLYADGSLVGSSSHSGDGLVPSDAPFTVGGDDLAVAVKSTKAFDSALTTDRVETGFASVPASSVLWLTYNTFHDTALEWRSEEVPGQWAYDGYSVPSGASEWYPPEGERGWYRREFDVPDGWEDGRLTLRFDAVYSHARVLVNGTKVAEHVGGYTPFEADITDVVDPDGTNTLAVAVSQRSEADEMGWQNVTGGITRDVTLVAVPDAHIGEWTVTTDLDDDGASARVSVDATVRNAGDSAIDSATVNVVLTDPDGSRVGTAESEAVTLAAGASESVQLDLDVADPRTWNPEQPRLYTLELTLHADGTTERVSDRIGIREIEVDGNQLRLNGEPLTLRGVNWEEIHLPEHGQALPPERTKRDARLLKEANVNYVRTAHHPTSEAFLDACDELGIVVEMEAPLMFVGRGRGDPYPDTVLSQTLEMVARDRNRTSVCLWSIANESEWYDVFDTVAQLVNELDPTRPTIFNHDVYDPADPWHDEYDVRAHHYPALRTGSTVGQHADLTDPILFDEYAHTYCYNDAELVTDPGLRDEWGRQFHTIWEQCRNADSVAGAALWAGGDHLEQWGEYLWGMLDRHRRPRPEYWHVKKTYAPVRVVDNEWIGGDALRLTVENRCEFVDLSNRTIKWESGDESGVLDLRIDPGETATTTITVGSDDVHLRVTHPLGFTIDSTTIDRPGRSPEAGDGRTGHEGAGSVLEADGTIRAETPDFSLEVDPRSGALSIEPRGADPIGMRCPELVVTPAQDATGRAYASIIDHRLDGRTVTGVDVDGDDDAIVIDVEYDGAEGAFVVYPLEHPVRLEYDFTLRETIDAREVGLALPLGSEFRTLTWERDGLWGTYPEEHVGRRSGTAVAFPEDDEPSGDELALDADRPWHHDVTARGSNDFRSTKRNVLSSGLSDGSSAVEVLADGDQHVRAQVRDDGVDLLVLDRSLAGATPDWIDRYRALGQEPTIERGTRLRGSTAVRFADGSQQVSSTDSDGGDSTEN